MESNAWYPLFTAAMILSGPAVHVKGLGFLLVSATKRLMVAWRSTREWKDAAFEPPSCEFGEEALDGVEPGGVGVNPRHPYFSGSMRYLQALGTLPKTGYIVCYKIRTYHSPLTEGPPSLVNAGFLR